MANGYDVADMASVLSMAHKIESHEEILATNLTSTVAEKRMPLLRDQLRNGMMEQEWSTQMHSELIEGGIKCWAFVCRRAESATTHGKNTPPG